MLDTNQKLIDPFFTRGRHKDIDVLLFRTKLF